MSRRLLTLLTILGLLAAAPAPAAAEDPWIRLPGTEAELNDVEGPVRVDGYVAADQGLGFYKRRGGTFVKTAVVPEDLSPDGRWRVAYEYTNYLKPPHKVTLIDRRSDRRVTVRLPFATGRPSWSPDSRSLLFTAYKQVRVYGTSMYARIGFVVLSVADRRPRLVRISPAVVPAEIDLYGRFSWTPDGKGVLGNLNPDEWMQHSLALYDLQGARRRVYRDVGEVAYRHSPAPFSPSGKLFVTRMEKPYDGEVRISVFDMKGGVHFEKVVDRFTEFYGWYDEDRLILSYADKDLNMTFKVVDLSDNVGMTLIKERGPAGFRTHIWRLYLTRT